MISVEDLILIERELQDVKSFYQDKRIFLTGGTGFFGKWILSTIKHLNEFCDLNISCTILSRDPNAFKSKEPELYSAKGFDFIQGSIENFEHTRSDYDYIIHAATDVTNNISGEEMTRTIMSGAKRVLKFANEVNAKKFLFTSSGAVYGSQPIELNGVTENYDFDNKIDPNDLYATGKLYSENIFSEKLKSQLVIARCFAFSGPYVPLDSKYAFGNFISNALNSEDIIIKGDGTTVRSYMYAADMVIWLLKIFAKSSDREVYNIGSSIPITIRELAEAISTKSNESKVHILHESEGKSSVYYPNTDKAEKDFGLKLYTSLDLAVDKTISFYK